MFDLKHDPLPKTPDVLKQIAAEQRLFGSTSVQHEHINAESMLRIKQGCQQRLNTAIIDELQRVGTTHAPAVYFSLVEELARGAVYTSDNAMFARASGRMLVELLTAEINAAIEERFGV